MTLKENLYQLCLAILNERIESFNKVLADLRESSKNETKSSAGDKFETARAMLQIELENTGRQLKETVTLIEALKRLDIRRESDVAMPGSLVRTDRGNFFISVAIGKIIIDDTVTIALSPQSPLGSKLLGCIVLDTISINGNTYKISGIE